MNEFVKRHEKKLKGLTKNSSVPFTHKDTVVNISSYFSVVIKVNVIKNLIISNSGCVLNQVVRRTINPCNSQFLMMHLNYD